MSYENKLSPSGVKTNLSRKTSSFFHEKKRKKRKKKKRKTNSDIYQKYGHACVNNNIVKAKE